MLTLNFYSLHFFRYSLLVIEPGESIRFLPIVQSDSIYFLLLGYFYPNKLKKRNLLEIFTSILRASIFLHTISIYHITT